MDKATVIVDYAYPCMMAEKALKDAHNATIESRIDEAIEHTYKALVETKIMLNSLKHMKEKEDDRH